LVVMAALACASAHAATHARDASALSDATRTAYEQYGLIDLPSGAVGRFFFLASATPDSTKVLFIVGAVPSDGLDLALTRGGAIVHRFHMMSPGKFLQTLRLAPGVYDLTVGSYAQSVVVPRLGRTALAQPIPMNSTAIIGSDSAIDVYLEAYGASDAPVTLCAPGWCDTLALRRNGDVSGGTVQVPLSRFAPGVTTLVFARGWDSAKSPVFVGFSYPIVGSFDHALDALRYLAPPERLDSLRTAPPDRRPQAWATFMAQYGSRLPEYFSRVSEANKRYGERGIPGWQTDRGSAYLQLGDPDQVFVEPDVEIWVYTRYFGRLRFDHHRLVPESRQMLATLVAQARSVR
jgi:GWxTD domain-containing protein